MTNNLNIYTSAEENIRKARAKSIEVLRTNGINPYPARWRRTHTITEAIVAFIELEEAQNKDNAVAKDTQTESVSVTGRVTGKREMGKIAFLDIKSDGDRLQVQFRSDLMPDSDQFLSTTDLGDFVGVTGSVIRTKRGEITIKVREAVMLSKSLRPLPDKWAGLKNPEMRHRRRYLDLITNDAAMKNARLRAAVTAAVRDFMGNQGFVEMETPILVPVAAGAQARPFVTRHNALGQNFYLRIATELPLKKLIVGGMEKVFEIGRVFRNEGIDHNHNPEFTTIEAYSAYSSYIEMMELLEQLVAYTVKKTTGSTTLAIPDGEYVDVSPPWQRLSMLEETKNRTGIDLTAMKDASALGEAMRSAGIHVQEGASLARLMDKVVSAGVEPHLRKPSFLIDYPVVMSPLAKRKPDAPNIAERFEAFVFGMEIANAFTELNDPRDQRERLEEQEKTRLEIGDDETDRLDEDFILALEHGMPPTGGIGMGIDRLTMLISGEHSIKEVVLFPTMRSLDSETNPTQK